MTEPVLRIRNLTLALPRGADRPHAVEDLSLENLALKQTGTLFEETFGTSVLLRMEQA